MDADRRRNYLQSPYFFMCCNLTDADLNRPGQLAAAHQGDDMHGASQSALAGTLVSSLHRLKDIDNTGQWCLWGIMVEQRLTRVVDGGFFVFPDISVRLEGEFRLRFSLFEMLKFDMDDSLEGVSRVNRLSRTAPKVVYIRSVVSEPFQGMIYWAW